MQVAMIGYGYWGRNVARAIKESGVFKLKSIFDLDSRQIIEAREKYFFEEYSSYQKILEDKDIDAVFIITPPQTHFHLALKALENHKHIFVEKPLCMSLKEAEILYEEAKKRNLCIHCDHIFLYAPAVRWLKENITELGDIVYINSRRINLGLFQNYVDVVWDLAIHDLSIIDHLVGLEIKDIEVFSRKYQNYPNEALANINLELQSGIIVTINVSWLSPIKVREMIIGGERKTAIYDETKSQKLAVFNSGVVIKDEFDKSNLYQKMVEYKLGDTFYPNLDTKMALNFSIETFYSEIQKKDLFLYQKSKEHVLRVIKVLELISKEKERIKK